MDHGQAAASTSDPARDPLQDLLGHPGPGSWKRDFLLAFPAQSWDSARVMVQAVGCNKHKARTGCSGAWDEVAHRGTEGARTVLKGSMVEGAESLPGSWKPQGVSEANFSFIMTADDTLGLS